MGKHPRNLACALVCLLVTGAGCGGDSGTSKADYRKQIGQIGEALRSDVVSVQDKLTATNGREARSDVFAEYEESVAGAADSIGELSPPDGAQGAQDRLVKSLRAGASDIAKAKEALRTKDAKAARAKARAAEAALRRDTAEAQRALAALRAKVD